MQIFLSSFENNVLSVAKLYGLEKEALEKNFRY